MTIRHNFFLLAIAALTAGCASQPLQINYISDPPGAMISQNGTYYGRAPIALNYAGVTAAFDHGQCATFSGLSARWPSGAEKKIDGYYVCPQSGKFQQIAFIRPTDAPNLALDVQAGFQAEQNAILQQQANASRESAEAAEAMAIIQATTPRPTAPAPMDCTSRVVHNTVQTSCQ